MAVKTNAELAAFFETGDQPSEAEFGHLIDTIQPKHEVLTDADATLTVASHAFRTTILPNISTTRTITLPAPTADSNSVYPWFHFVYLPLVADSGTWTIQTASDNNQFFEGGVIWSDTNSDAAGDTDIVFGNGSADDHFSIVNAKHADFWLLGKSSTVWYIWGSVVGDTAPTISNA